MNPNKDKNTRRKVLKILSTVSVAGPIIGRETIKVEATDTKSEVRSKATIPFGLRVKNKSLASNAIQVELFETEKNGVGEYEAVGEPVYKDRFPLNGINESGGNAANLVKDNLDLDGGRVYEVKSSTLDSDQKSGSSVVGIPEGGVPDYMAILVDYTLSEELEVYTAKQ